MIVTRDAFINDFRRAILNRISIAYTTVLREQTVEASAAFHDVLTEQLILAAACYHAERIAALPSEDREIRILTETMSAHPDMFDKYETSIRTILSVMLNCD